MLLYLKPRLIVIGLLGFFSGLPLALTAGTLTAWLADSGVDRTAIGLFAAIATPYAFKFLWAPLMDGLTLPLLGRLGRRRSWLLLMQLVLVIAIAMMSRLDPAHAPFLVALVGVMIATASASQDIVIDAYRVERLPVTEQGAGAAMATFGYRIGMLISGAGVLYLADQYGWGTAYFLMSGVMALGAGLTLFIKEVSGEVSPTSSSFIPPACGGSESLLRPPSTRHASLATFFQNYVLAPLRDFMQRDHWLLVLAFVILYKLGDAFLGVMFNPFLLDLGFTKTQIAAVAKFYGLIATILGAFMGGWLVLKIGMFRSLMICGLVHMLTNLLLVVQARLGADLHFLIVSISLENFSGGMATSAFVAYLSALCQRHYTATQYALLSSLAAFGRTWLSTPSGWVSERLGWEWFFIVSCLISLPSLALLWWIEKHKRRGAPAAAVS
jgi:MFS transporter, PAT family, beta-lactamase induction signal transducer AmpG